MTRQLQQAKNQLSKVIHDAHISGPQPITVRCKATAVILSIEDYQNLIKKLVSLLSFFQASPWAETELDISRSNDIGRDIEQGCLLIQFDYNIFVVFSHKGLS